MSTSKFWRPVRKRVPTDHEFTSKPRFPRVAEKRVDFGNKPHGTYLTRHAGFVVLPERMISSDGRVKA